jgi:hypothetical protein
MTTIEAALDEAAIGAFMQRTMGDAAGRSAQLPLSGNARAEGQRAQR